MIALPVVPRSWRLRRVHGNSAPQRLSECARPAPAGLIQAATLRAALNIGRSKVFDLIRSGHLRSVKAGGSRRISATALREYVARLEAGEDG